MVTDEKDNDLQRGPSILSDPEPCDAVANGFVKLNIVANAVLFLLSTNIMLMADKPWGLVPS